MLLKTRKPFPKSQTLANRSCNRNEVFVKGFSADQKRELVRDLRKKYRGVRITSDSRGEYIVYEDETRNIRSTYLSPEHLVRKVRIEKPRPTKKTVGKGNVGNSVRTFNAMGSARQLNFSQIYNVYNAPRTPKKIIQSLSPTRLSKSVLLRVPSPIQPQLKQELSPRELTYSVSAIIKPDDIRDILDKISLPRDSILIPNRTSSSLNLSADSEEKKLNRFIIKSRSIFYYY